MSTESQELRASLEKIAAERAELVRSLDSAVLQMFEMIARKRNGVAVRRTGNLDTIRAAVDKIRSGEVQDLTALNYTDLVHVEELQISDTEPLRGQLDSFTSAVKGHTRPEVTFEEGLAAVETATRIVEAMGKQAL